MAKPKPTSFFPQITHQKKRAFLRAFLETGQVRASCLAVRLDHSHHYYWLNHDPVYADAFEETKRIAALSLEEEAIRRARDGVTRAVYHQGERVGEELVYSDTLLIFLLKGWMPEKYRERHEVTGKDGAPLPPTVLFLPAQAPSADEWAQSVQHLMPTNGQHHGDSLPD